MQRTTLLIYFGRTENSFPGVRISSVQLEVVVHAKILGLTISSNLKWKEHVSNIIKKANKRFLFYCPAKTCESPYLRHYQFLFHLHQTSSWVWLLGISLRTTCLPIRCYWTSSEAGMLSSIIFLAFLYLIICKDRAIQFYDCHTDLFNKLFYNVTKMLEFFNSIIIKRYTHYT